MSTTQLQHALLPVMPRPRRKSSGLGAELRGDNSAVALSTLEPPPSFASPPLTPRPSNSKSPRLHSKRRKARSHFRRWKDFSFRHTWANPLILICAIFALYALNPRPSNPLHGAIFLSYPLIPTDSLLPYHAQPDRTYYGKGPLDFAFVGFYIIVLSFTREFLMQRYLRPLAIYCNIRTRAKQNRFMEQLYTAIYFAVFGPLGLYVMSRTPVWYFDTAGMFEGFPHRSHEGVFKAYYLLQASYWAQQAIVLCLQLEKPRKDFKELVGHHVVTLALIWLSYRFHFTYMGVAVYITHDISDFFLATSKTLNYLSSPVTVPYFTLFMAVWIYLRHYLNILILLSVILPAGAFTTVGPFTLDWPTQQYKCWISQYITFALLAALQALNLFWFFFVVRIAYNVLAKELVADVRSDDEDDGEGEDEGEQGSESELSSQVSAVDAAAELEKLQPEMLKGENGSAGAVNGHALPAGKSIGLVGLGIDARKGSLKEGSDEEELEHKDSWGNGNGHSSEGKKDI